MIRIMAEYKSPLRILLGGLGGLLIGTVLGLVLLVLAIMVSNSTFGLTNVWPGGAAGGILGLLVGVTFPETILMVYRSVYRDG